MVRLRRTSACDRAAQWISLDLDGELSELERAGLARHLERCERCRATRSDFGAFTDILRSTPPARRSSPVLVTLPGRPGTRARRRGAVALLASSAALAAVFTALPHPGAHAPSAALPTAREHRVLADEHARTEPTLYWVADTPPPQSFASRALV
jgi:anti-sigma factor RsiW